MANPNSAYQAYQSTEDDVANVLASHKLLVSRPAGQTLDELAAELFEGLDFGLIEEAALAGDDLDEQTGYANDEIARQLYAAGVLMPSQPTAGDTEVADRPRGG